jgi:nicotinate-nucleotide--dimethylbenzimidazole phosphoribosyltransferase
MASLTAHLRRPDEHSRLAFHPECPLCRGERLVGTLPPNAVVSRRTQALLTAGVLALSSATPTVAIAAEPDQEQEGAATPEQVAVDVSASDPGMDPGGNATELPYESRQTPSSQPTPDPAGDAGAVEQEPVTNQQAPVADAGDGSATQAPPTADPVPAPAEAPPATPEAPAATSEQADTRSDSGDATVSPDPAEATAPSSEPEADQPADRARGHKHKRDAAPKPGPAPVPASAPPPQLTEEAPAAASTPVAVQVAQQPPDADTANRPAGRGDRVHVVEPGESLWSIARDLLGEGASTARIAREVNRLWELNSERMRTGDRNLLLVGTRLALR